MIMSLEMQRLVLKEIMEELKNYDRILNSDNDRLNIETCKKLLFVHDYLLDEDNHITEHASS